MKNSLWLFDIDGTLVDTGGAGMSALVDATREVFGSDGPELDLAGATDSGLLIGIYRAFERDADDETTALFYERYLEHLEQNLADPCFGGRPLEGATSLLAEMEEAGYHKGLLTGNIAAGAEAKMRAYGMAHHFRFGAFGDDHHERDRLGPIALERAEREFGKAFAAKDVFVIGDTPKDIRCAKAIDAKSVAVATGRFTFDELKQAGADLVLESLDSPDEFFARVSLL
ncbi:MAG: HAD family hydrolase [Verrucomicrobiota bacterium JB023]|nr:HAD family hydrolase [Verrucomicrobiota bacterium JB023]